MDGSAGDHLTLTNEGIFAMDLPTSPSSSANSTDSTMLQLHLAEYNALTQRITNRMLILYSLYSVLVVFVALAAQVWTTLNRSLLIWGGALAIQGIGFIAGQVQFEMYNDVLYIETDLRSDIQRLVGNDQRFWGYEGFLAKLRPKRLLWSEWGYVAFGIVGLAACLYWSFPLSRWDYVGLLGNILMLGVLCRTTSKFYAVRGRFQKGLIPKIG